MVQAPFVGRRRELADLARLLDRCRVRSEPVVALVTGEAGIGKTRLLRELCDARLHGRNRHAVHGYEMERMVPLAAAAGLLESLIDVAGEGVRLAALLGDGPTR